MSSASCIFCERNRSDEVPDGGWVLRQELVSAYILPGAEYPGWFVLQVNRHAEGYQEFTEDEAAAVGRACWTLARAVGRAVGGSRVYQYAIGEVYPHFHMLIGPPPAEADERGKLLICQIITRDPRFLDVARSHATAARVADAVRELTEKTQVQP